MIWRLCIAAFLTAVISLFALSAPHAQFNGCPAGFCNPPAISIPGYVGPGDIVTFAEWGGLRAYNAAYATGSNNAANICDAASGLTCQDIVILANGKFDVATASGSASCSVSCNVKILYDQTGGGHNKTFANSNRPILTFNCIGTLPCMVGTIAAQTVLQISSISITGPVTYVVPFNIAATGAVNSMYGGVSVNTFVDSNTKLGVFCGTATIEAGAISAGTWYHNTSVCGAGGTGAVYLDGSSIVTGTPGNTSLSAEALSMFQDSSNSHFFGGKLFEGGTVAGQVSAGNAATLSSNFHTFCGC